MTTRTAQEVSGLELLPSLFEEAEKQRRCGEHAHGDWRSAIDLRQDDPPPVFDVLVAADILKCCEKCSAREGAGVFHALPGVSREGLAALLSARWEAADDLVREEAVR